MRLRALLGERAPEAPLAERVEPALDPPPEESQPPVGPRFALEPRAVVAILLVAVIGVALAVAVLLRARPQETALVPAAVVATGTPVPGAAGALERPAEGEVAGPSSERSILVDVQGKVRRPGVVHLPAGSRVLDALRAAGGPRRGVSTTSLNLARSLTDGEQVVLEPVGGGPGGGAPVGSSGAGAVPGPVSGPIDLNAADLAALDSLPGVGPVLAQRILDWRAENGRFSAVEELQEVPGIGPATYADLRLRVRV